MMTIGDVLAAVAILVGIGVTGWAMLVGLLFAAPNAVARGRARIEANAAECALVGILYLLVPLFGLILSGAPFPIFKLGGLGIVGVSVLIAGVGVAGLASILADRIAVESGLSAYAAKVKASAFLAAAVQLPGIGWLVAFPALLLIGLGAGFPAVHRFARRAKVQPEVR